MMIRSGLQAVSLLTAAILAGGTALSQTSSRYDYPEQDRAGADAGDWGDDAADSSSSVPAQPENDFSDVVTGDEQRGSAPSRRATTEDREPLLSHDDGETEKMTNACALAARDEAERDGGYAEVRQMGEPRESRNGFIIDGDVDVRSSWRVQDGQSRHFSCTIANGRIEDVYFQRDRADR